MKTLSLKLLVLYLIHLSLMEVYSKPPKHARRSSFDNSIFRNRANRCITLLENMEEMEELNQVPVDDDFEVVPIKQSEENLDGDVKEKDVNKEIRKESVCRRFLRCLMGKSNEPVGTISYKKKNEEVTIEKEIKEDEIPESSAKPTIDNIEDGTNKTTNISIQPKITRRNAPMTGTLTEIGTTRLPQTDNLSVSLDEDLAIPGPSNINIEKKEFPTLEERNKLRRRWLECNGNVFHVDTSKDKPKDDKEDKNPESKL